MRTRSLAALGLLSLAMFTSTARSAHAQDVLVVTGRVTSEVGAPLPANIVVDGQGAATSADADGRYRLSIALARVATPVVTLRVRALGYVPESRTLNASAGTITEDFTLRKDVNRLEEIIVTGTVAATSQKKLGYAVTKLDAADMPVTAPNALLSLQGKVPGALIVQPSGRPGASPAIVLRSPKSLAAGGRQQGPLIIVDGTILNGNAQDLDPADIESIEVIKGAAASSLYGSRAAAGVIQITTKSGDRAGQDALITARSEIGFNDTQREFAFARRHFLMMDERNERYCIKEAGQPACSRVVDFDDEAARVNNTLSSSALTPRTFERDYSLAPAPSIPELKGLFQVNQWPRSYDPVAQALTNGATRNTNVSIAAHPGNTDYFASLSDFAQEGAVRFLKGYRRNTLRANVDQARGGHWQIGLRSSYARGTQFPASDGQLVNVAADDFFRITRVPAGVNLLRYDDYGRLFIRSNPLSTGLGNTNPLYAFANSEGRLDDDRLIASLTVAFTPSPWLTLDAVGSTDRRRTSESIYRDREYRTTTPFGSSNITGGTQGYVYQGNTSDFSHNLLLSAKARSRGGSNWQGALMARASVEQEDLASSSGEGQQLTVSGPRTLGNALASTVLVQSSTSSIRALGALAGGQLEYRGRYIVDALLRYDGSSLFGANQRWYPYYRASLAWRVSDEARWPFPHFANDVKVRGSVGTAGGRPRFDAQYESFKVSTGGQVDALTTLGNPDLKPEHTTETEFGLDAELLGKFGVSLTHAHDVTTDELLRVPAPVSSGYPNQWRNAGTLDSKIWELSLRIPILATRSVTWTSQLGWDRMRTHITALDRPPFFDDVTFNGNGGIRFRVAAGERYGTMYGHEFVTNCAELPAPFDAQCGPGEEWQANDEGYVVWVGQGRSWRDGVTSNLWQAVRPGCLKNGVPFPTATSAVDCTTRGGTVNTPWGSPVTHWGMPTVLRDSTLAAVFAPIGNTMPDYRVTMTHSIQWRRVTLYGLVDASRGNKMLNLERQWSLGDFLTREVDQNGKTPETAKPLGYYWRETTSASSLGVGGFYDTNLNGSNRTIEDASYTKLRELSVTYDLRRLPLVAGEWSVSFIGRNLHTWTKYSGWDPEMGLNSGTPQSAAIATAGMFQYPPTRSFTLSVLARL